MLQRFWVAITKKPSPEDRSAYGYGTCFPPRLSQGLWVFGVALLISSTRTMLLKMGLHKLKPPTSLLLQIDHNR